jgi:uncharacterized protein
VGAVRALHDQPVQAGPSKATASRSRDLALTVGILVLVPVAGRFGPRPLTPYAGPIGAALMLLVARLAGMSADDVGLGRRSWRRGAAYAGVCVAAVAGVYALAAVLPGTRLAFFDERYRTDLGTAARTAFVVIPFGRVLFEEVAFRGVLWGLVRSGHGAARATLVSSVLFGFWHVLPSLQLNQVNPAIAEVVGRGRAGQALAVAGAVLFTGCAGALLCELRRRSGSLLAPFGLHWAVNGLGALVTATVTR